MTNSDFQRWHRPVLIRLTEELARSYQHGQRGKGGKGFVFKLESRPSSINFNFLPNNNRTIIDLIWLNSSQYGAFMVMRLGRGAPSTPRKSLNAVWSTSSRPCWVRLIERRREYSGRKTYFPIGNNDDFRWNVEINVDKTSSNSTH